MIKDESDPSNRAGLWLIRGSKAGTTEYTFFDDITYSTGKKRKKCFLIFDLSTQPRPQCSDADILMKYPKELYLGVRSFRNKNKHSLKKNC